MPEARTLIKMSMEKKKKNRDILEGLSLFSWIIYAEQLCNIFLLSFQQQKLPKVWKKSIIAPIAKTTKPTSLNDFRPVALTSLVMKSLEKLISMEVLLQVEKLIDPLKFAYRPCRSVYNAGVTLLNFLYCQLDGAKVHARLLFIDFSSAFNTIQPHLLADKLLNQFGWILDFLTNSFQCVRVNGCFSNQLNSSTGSPQDVVPLPYYTF